MEHILQIVLILISIFSFANSTFSEYYEKSAKDFVSNQLSGKRLCILV